MPVLTFPIVPAGDFCLACGVSMAQHGDRCRDEVIGRDQETVARRLRLARLQIGRALKVRTIANRVEGVQ
jgi:hypothetical protein